MTIGITLYQVIAKNQDGETLQTWPLVKTFGQALTLKARLEAEDREYQAECRSDGYDADLATFSIFSADADFFA